MSKEYDEEDMLSLKEVVQWLKDLEQAFIDLRQSVKNEHKYMRRMIRKGWDKQNEQKI